jgi:hypothetical protein
LGIRSDFDVLLRTALLKTCQATNEDAKAAPRELITQVTADG